LRRRARIQRLLELTMLGGEIGFTFGLGNYRELLSNAIERFFGPLGLIFLQCFLGLFQLGPDQGRSLHRAGVVGIEHLGHAPQVVAGLGGLGEQAHCGEGDHHDRRRSRDRAEYGATSAARPAGGADHRQGGVCVHQQPVRVGMHLTTPGRQDARQLPVNVADIARRAASTAEHVNQHIVGLDGSQISGHLRGIPVGAAVGVTGA
jgi:hypothetical protein